MSTARDYAPGMSPRFDTLTARDVADIALQRTQHLWRAPIIGCPSYRAWVRGFELPLLLESRLRRKAILNGAWADAEREWEPIAPCLPADGALCDIGCGHAFIDLVAAQGSPAVSLTLIDIERTEAKHHEWNSKGAGYSNLANAREFLRVNGVDDVALCNPTRDPLPDGPFDLIISLLSAGFHYPIATYADFIARTLKPGGALIFDMRDGTDQGDALKGFAEVRELAVSKKSRRVVAVRG